MNLSKSTEKNLIRLVNNGDEQARYLLYNRYNRYLSALCSRYISNDENVKDVLQESFIKIFSSLESFRYQGEGSLKAWMSRIVLNESLNWLRGSKHLEFVEMSNEVIDMPDEPPNTDGVPSDIIYQMIRSLPDGYRTVFNLYVVEEKSHKEIANMLGIKESTSASQLHRAKAMLAAMINQFSNNKNIRR